MMVESVTGMGPIGLSISVTAAPTSAQALLRAPATVSTGRGWATSAPVRLGWSLGIGMGGASASDSPSASRPAVTSSVTSTVTATVQSTVTAGPTPTATVTATTKVTAPPPPPVADITEGVWTVGVDIKAGNYKVIAPIEEQCYWKISKTGSNGDDIISNDLPSGGRPQVRLRAGQDFETKDCGDSASVK